MPNKYFQSRVKELRGKADLTMEALATELGVTKSRVNMWENKGTVPRMDALVKLAKRFNVTTDYLLGNDDRTPIDPSKSKLNSLQRNLGKLNEEELEKAEGMLKAVFKDIFNDEDDDDDI